MHFLPDVYVPCEVCGGKRYNRETLDVKYKGKSIYDVLDMTVEEALEFFKNVPKIQNKIQSLYDVGLSYVKLGQRPQSFRVVRHSVSSLPQSLAERAPERPYIYLMSLPQDCTLQMYTSLWRYCAGYQTEAIL